MHPAQRYAPRAAALMPEQPKPEDSRALPGWLAILLAAAVASVTSFGIVAMRQYADYRRTTENLLTRVESETNLLNAIKWQSIARERTTRRYVNEADAAQQNVTYIFQALVQRDPDNIRLAQAQALFNRVTSSLNEMFQLLAAEKLFEAQEVAERKIDPASDELRALVGEVVLSEAAAADQASRIADGGTITLLGIASMSIALLLLRFERTRRQASAMAIEQEALLKSEERFRALVQNNAELIMVISERGSIRFQSPSAERLLGEMGAPGKSFYELVHPSEAEIAHGMVTEALISARNQVTQEFRVRTLQGDWLVLETIASNLCDHPGVGGILLTSRDITERKELEGQLLHHAFHDPLTSLPNRSLFMDRLEHAIERSTRTTGSIAVLFLDLDDFKVINDSLGHKAGDQLLVSVAERIEYCLRPGDTIARLGGDEFTVLLEDVAEPEDGIRVAERIARQMRAPFSLDGREVFVSASIGIAFRSERDEQPDDLLRNADAAMYAAKQKGKSSYAVFDAKMNAKAWHRLELESDLRRAIERDEFEVYYQPVISLRTGEIVEIEALVRWRHPERGIVSPGEFIGLAEETGIIWHIGRYVLVEACSQTREWQLKYPRGKPLVVSVNLSGKQFQHPSLVADIGNIISDSGLPPTTLKLEITESVMMSDGASAIGTLQQLKSLGVQLAVDDFGTGYSSLAYLQRFPIDVLKVDQSFVSHLGQSAESTEIVRAIIGLAKTLKLDVTAEGIETEDQLRLLQQLGADRGQGYFISRPRPGPDMGAVLAWIHTQGTQTAA